MVHQIDSEDPRRRKSSMKISTKILYQLAWAIEIGAWQARQTKAENPGHKTDLKLLNNNLMDYARIFRDCASKNKAILIED